MTLLPTLPDTVERKAQELALLLQLGTLQRTAFGYAAVAHGQTLNGQVSCVGIAQTESLPHVLMGLYTHHFGRRDQAVPINRRRIADHRPASAESDGTGGSLPHAMGSHLFSLGEFQTAHTFFQLRDRGL
ncbi:MAG: hypothetical protein R2867_32700 [Caldilineaceae bacterium]